MNWNSKIGVRVNSQKEEKRSEMEIILGRLHVGLAFAIRIGTRKI